MVRRDTGGLFIWLGIGLLVAVALQWSGRDQFDAGVERVARDTLRLDRWADYWIGKRGRTLIVVCCLVLAGTGVGLILAGIVLLIFSAE